MSRQGDRDRGKERFWRRMLRGWRRSGRGVRDFCAAQRLAEPSFYSWRRTIAARDRQAAPPAPRQRRSDGNGRPARSESGKAHGGNTPVFLPVRVPPIGAAALEVVLPDGRVVRVPVGFDTATLRLLLAVLAEAPPC